MRAHNELHILREYLDLFNPKIFNMGIGCDNNMRKEEDFLCLHNFSYIFWKYFTDLSSRHVGHTRQIYIRYMFLESIEIPLDKKPVHLI